MIFTAAELRSGVTENGYVLLFTQSDLDAQKLKAIVLDADGEACQKEKLVSPFLNQPGAGPLWYVAGHEQPQSPTLPAALVWDPAMISARKAMADK